MKKINPKEISVPPSPRRIRFKACIALVSVLLLPLFGLVLGALMDHIIAGLVAGQALGLVLALLITNDMEKDFGLSVPWGFAAACWLMFAAW